MGDQDCDTDLMSVVVLLYTQDAGRFWKICSSSNAMPKSKQTAREIHFVDRRFLVVELRRRKPKQTTELLHFVGKRFLAP